MITTLADFGPAQTLGPTEPIGAVRSRLFDTWLAVRKHRSQYPEDEVDTRLVEALKVEGATLRRAANRSGSTILLSVDQAEEIMRSEGESGEALADYLRAAIETNGWRLVFTIRSDSLPELQKHKRFERITGRGYDLRAIPSHRFASLIEQPARRYGVEVEPKLVDALIKDTPESDALPLLAFALQRLWQQYSDAGKLTNEQYSRFEGVRGIIADAAERALRSMSPDSDEPMPAQQLSARLDRIGATTFIPALVQVNNEGSVVRKAAEWSKFNEEEQDLLRCMAKWRLVVFKAGQDDVVTVEVAHEAIFRDWPRLDIWLRPYRASLETLRLLQFDAEVWKQNGCSAAFLNLHDDRLGNAHQLTRLPRLSERLSATDLHYLESCRYRWFTSRMIAYFIYISLSAIILYYFVFNEFASAFAKYICRYDCLESINHTNCYICTNKQNEYKEMIFLYWWLSGGIAYSALTMNLLRKVGLIRQAFFLCATVNFGCFLVMFGYSISTVAPHVLALTAATLFFFLGWRFRWLRQRFFTVSNGSSP